MNEMRSTSPLLHRTLSFVLEQFEVTRSEE